MIADVLKHLVEPRLETVAPPVPPAAFQQIRITLKPQMPMRVKLYRNDRRVMGPVFEQRAVCLIKPLQILRTIAGPPREQDQIMRPRNGIDAVQLNKTQIVDHTAQIRAFTRPGRRISQSMAMQKNRPRGLGIQPRSGHVYRRRSVSP